MTLRHQIISRAETVPKGVDKDLVNADSPEVLILAIATGNRATKREAKRKLIKMVKRGKA